MSESTSGLRPAHQQALSNFGNMPDDAEVSVQVVAALFGITTPTVWRWAASGRLEKPVRRGGVTRWKVRAIRQSLAAA